MNLRDWQKKASERREEEFFSQVSYSDNCWDWTGYLSSGYGIFYYDRKMCRAHRFSYEYFLGKIPEGLHICHHCDNKKCVNPFHLFAWTVADNMRDCVEKKRHGNLKKTSCIYGHPLSGENLIISVHRGVRRRACRICCIRIQREKYRRSKNRAEVSELLKKLTREK